MPLAAATLLLAGCGSGGGGDGKGDDCTWSMDAFLPISQFSVAADRPTFTSDSRGITCNGSDVCAASGAWTPLRPGEQGTGREAADARCNGTYSYEVHVETCGESVQGPWHSQVGWLPDYSVLQADELGVGLWAARDASCWDAGWQCGCWGTLPGASTPTKVSGGLRLVATIDTTDWPWYTVVFHPPPGATASKGAEDAPVEPKTKKTNMPLRRMARVRPSFMLRAGTTLRLAEEHAPAWVSAVV